MDILLVVPPIFTTEEGIEPPIGLISIATYLKENTDVSVEIMDFAYEILANNITICSNLYTKLAEKILEREPLFVGISIQNISLSTSINLSKKLKELNGRTQIIFGGPGVDGLETEILNNFSQVDFIIQGEGEIALAELVVALKDGTNLAHVSGLVRRDYSVKGIVTNRRALIKNLNTLPSPDMSLVNTPAAYSEAIGFQRTGVNVELARGCGGRCHFCGCSSFWGGVRRTFSAKSVVNHIVNLKQKYCIDHIYLSDDNFLVNPIFASIFCDEIIQRDVSISWDTRGRINSINDEILALLNKAGCSHILIGVESTSNEILKDFNKNIDSESQFDKIMLVINAGILPILSFILGHPLETNDSLHQTLLLLCRIYALGRPVAAHLHMMTLIPGTALYRKEIANLDVEKKIFKCRGYRIGNVPMLKEDEELIERYPEIFSSFYNVKTKNLDIELLEFISKHYVYLVQTFPLSFYLLYLYEYNLVDVLSSLAKLLDGNYAKNSLISSFFKFVQGSYKHSDLLEMAELEYKLDFVSKANQSAECNLILNYDLFSYRQKLRKGIQCVEKPASTSRKKIRITADGEKISIHGKSLQ